MACIKQDVQERKIDICACTISTKKRHERALVGELCTDTSFQGKSSFNGFELKKETLYVKLPVKKSQKHHREGVLLLESKVATNVPFHVKSAR